MRVAVRSKGAGVPDGDFSGTILAVHPRVSVLALADETLLTLAVPAIGRLPRGISLDVTEEFSFTDVLTTGAVFAARAGILRITGSRLSIDLRPAMPWRSCLGDLHLDPTRQSVLRALAEARAVLLQDGRSVAFIAVAGARLAALRAATQALDTRVAGEAMSELVGLGDGTTPAGDDYLVGWFAGLWATAGTSIRRTAFVTTLGERLKRSASRTGRASRVYLEAAADGEVSERLCELATCIAAGSAGLAVRRAAAAVLAVGHSSGACGLLGFLDACACWSHANPAEQSAHRTASGTRSGSEAGGRERPICEAGRFSSAVPIRRRRAIPR